MTRKPILAVILTLLASVNLMAQTLPQGVKKMASMGGITEFDFPNGLSVLLYPDAAAPKLTIKVFLHCEIALAKAFYSVKLSIF